MTSTSIYTSAIPILHSKICNKCKLDKTLTEYSKSKRAKDGYQEKCKICDKEYRKTNKEYIKDRDKERNKEYRKANPIYYKQYHQTNKEHNNARSKEYNKINRGTLNANSARYRAAKLLAIPLWVELDLIDKLYIECRLISKITNIKHHVDHIVPLQSDIVCGLHCFDTLRILSATENHSKSNLYWPDMP